MDAAEPLADLLAELVERRAETGRVQELGELGGVTVEVGAEQHPHPADRRVPLGLVEQLVDERGEGATVAEEPLEGARQATIAIGEVGPQHVLHGPGGLLVGCRRLGDQLLELATDDIGVHRGRGILERQQADPERTLHDRGAFRVVTLGERGRERAVGEDETLDEDPVAVDSHGWTGSGLPRRRAGRGLQREDSGFHGGSVDDARAT